MVDWPPSPTGIYLTFCTTITEAIKYFYEWGITLGGLAAFIALIIAGFLYLTSIGDPNKMKEAKGRILCALGGLTLLLASWLILDTINPQLTTIPIDLFGALQPPIIVLPPPGEIEFEISSCDYVKFYKNKDCIGDYITIPVGGIKDVELHPPLWAKAGKQGSPAEGGIFMCHVKLYAGGRWLGIFGCRELISDIIVREKCTPLPVDREVRCITVKEIPS